MYVELNWRVSFQVHIQLSSNSEVLNFSMKFQVMGIFFLIVIDSFEETKTTGGQHNNLLKQHWYIITTFIITMWLIWQTVGHLHIHQN